MSRPIRPLLQQSLRAALKARDTEATAAYRAALAALDNATAVPLTEADRAGAVETSRVGAGAAETARRELSEDDQRQIVREEAQDRAAAAEALPPNRDDAVQALRRQATRLLELLATENT